MNRAAVGMVAAVVGVLVGTAVARAETNAALTEAAIREIVREEWLANQPAIAAEPIPEADAVEAAAAGQAAQIPAQPVAKVTQDGQGVLLDLASTPAERSWSARHPVVTTVAAIAAVGGGYLVARHNNWLGLGEDRVDSAAPSTGTTVPDGGAGVTLNLSNIQAPVEVTITQTTVGRDAEITQAAPEAAEETAE